ncbi:MULTISPECIES: hypothetical protein [Enterobacter cloacae complex]|uniref:hypothetical protein n=1 Tax=Enterobacter cloacae complex TaxID=354276 RepID=UPI0032AF6E50
MEPIEAPESLCIYSGLHRRDSLSFLNRIEVLAVNEGKRVEIDLTKVVYASAAASLLFFAIVSRAQLLTGDPHIFRFKFPKKDENLAGHGWIVSTGLSKALVAGTPSKLEALTSEKRFFQSAVEPFAHMASTVGMLQSGAHLNHDQLHLLVTAIGEALLNVSHHAYDDPRFQLTLELFEGKRWWQCAWFNPEKDNVVFIICDLGVGIFESFTRSGSGVSIEKQVSSVAKAMLVGESRFVDAGRGNGSEDIKRPIKLGSEDTETLLILTGNVHYSYNSNDKEPRCEKLAEYIPGTLLQWSLTPRR